MRHCAKQSHPGKNLMQKVVCNPGICSMNKSPEEWMLTFMKLYSIIIKLYSIIYASFRSYSFHSSRGSTVQVAFILVWLMITKTIAESSKSRHSSPPPPPNELGRRRGLIMPGSDDGVFFLKIRTYFVRGVQISCDSASGDAIM